MAWHGHSGNVAVDAAEPQAIRAALRAASGRDWAMVPAEVVVSALSALEPVREEDGVRWTPGLAFSLERAVIISVVKRDAMAGSPRQGAPGRRLGSGERPGGPPPRRWTARSWRPVAGLLRQL